jgi:hypothetical protein
MSMATNQRNRIDAREPREMSKAGEKGANPATDMGENRGPRPGAGDAQHAAVAATSGNASRMIEGARDEHDSNVDAGTSVDADTLSRTME